MRLRTRTHTRDGRPWQVLALTNMGVCLLYGIGGAHQNFSAAVDLFHKAAARGCGNAMNALARVYTTGEGVTINYTRALAYLEEAAARHQRDAMLTLGSFHRHGGGWGLVERNYTKALAYFYRAGSLAVLPHMAAMHEAGEGVQPSCEAAMQWWRVLAEAGPWQAEMDAALGAFRRADYRGAFVRYVVLAQLGIAPAFCNVAYLYHYHRTEVLLVSGRNSAAQLAHYYYLRCSELGQSFGYLGLAHLYADGREIGKNEPLAVELYAAARDIPEAPLHTRTHTHSCTCRATRTVPMHAARASGALPPRLHARRGTWRARQRH